MPPRALMINPTVCGEPLSTSIGVDSWQNPGVFVTENTSPLVMTGCDRLSFDPSISVAPESRRAGAPSGYAVSVHVPQPENIGDRIAPPLDLATPNLRDAVVRLPAGVAVDPAQATGLQGCSLSQIGLDNVSEPACPDASKIGSVEVDTPLLPDPLRGAVFVAQQGNAGPAQGSNPFGSLLAIYVTAEGDGALIKLAGHIETDPVTGQIKTTFSDAPQLPFSDFKLRFFGGPRAALVNPPACGSYTTTSSLLPWSAPGSGAAATPSSTFAIDEGVGCVIRPGVRRGHDEQRGGWVQPVHDDAHAPGS